jgi:CheY-like chemotaxis protein
MGPATVLVAENEALIRLELADQLRGMGMIVIMVSDADEAIAMLDTHPEIEVLVTDISMPGSMDGIRLAHHVRDRWPPVKIIVTSGSTGTELSQLPDGSIFLAKPYAPESIEDAMAHVMNKSGSASPGASPRA